MSDKYDIFAEYVPEEDFKKQIGDPCNRTLQRYYSEPGGLSYVTVKGKRYLRKTVIADWLRRRETQKNPLRKRGDRQRAAAPAPAFRKPLRPARPPKRTPAKKATAAAMATSAPGETTEA